MKSTVQQRANGRALGLPPALHKVPSGFVLALLALALILLFDLFFTPNFFDVKIVDGHLYGSLVDILFWASPIMLMGIGMTLAIATKGIDISVGSVAAISGALAALLVTQENVPFWLVVLLPVLLSVIIGAWNGVMVAVFGIQPIVATLIIMVSGRGIAQLITSGQILTFHNKALEFVGNGFFLGFPFFISVVLVVLFAAVLMTRRTALGLFIESVGINSTSSRYSGIPVSLIVFLVYVVSGFCAGTAGLFYCSEIKGADANNAGLFTELDAILAVVIGGTSMDGGKFFFGGTLVGALVMQSLTTTILSFGVPVQGTLFVKGAVVILLVLLQSEQFRSVVSRRKFA